MNLRLTEFEMLQDLLRQEQLIRACGAWSRYIFSIGGHTDLVRRLHRRGLVSLTDAGEPVLTEAGRSAVREFVDRWILASG